MWRMYARAYPHGSTKVMKSSIRFSKNTLFSHNVSSASMRMVFRRMNDWSFGFLQARERRGATQSVYQRRGSFAIAATRENVSQKYLYDLTSICAGRQRAFPERPSRWFAAHQSASNIPGNRGSATWLLQAPVACAKSYRAISRDEAAGHPLA